MNEVTIDIYFRDLCEEKQQEILKAFGIDKEEDMNWDVQPIATIPIPEE